VQAPFRHQAVPEDPGWKRYFDFKPGPFSWNRTQFQYAPHEPGSLLDSQQPEPGAVPDVFDQKSLPVVHHHQSDPRRVCEPRDEDVCGIGT
jgi:hypothetical protein